MVLFTIPEMIIPQLFWMLICCMIVGFVSYYAFVPRLNKADRLRKGALADLNERIQKILEYSQSMEKQTRLLESDMNARMQKAIVKLYQEFESKAEAELALIKEGILREEKRMEIEMKKSINQLKLGLTKMLPQLSEQIAKKFAQ